MSEIHPASCAGSQTGHHWFRSGDHSILAHVHVPDIPARSGVVIVPPFGWDDICAHRPLRSLARSLASRGVAVLRFDLPGTGDSSGSALDQKLLAAWIGSVRDAVAELKALTGVETVSILGVRLGALLALAAASAGTPVDNLILWGASATGRAILRELRAFRNLEVSEPAEGEAAPPQPVDGIEVAGFLINRETESDLEALSAVDIAPMPGQRVVLLTRDSFPHDNKLVQVLERAGCQVMLKSGAGYQDMLSAPHEPLPFSAATEELIWECLNTQPDARKTLATSAGKLRDYECSCRVEEGVLESILTLPYREGTLFSVLARSADRSQRSEWGLLFMNAGGVRHIGPNRMWVEAARRWAARGVPSARIDFQRVGESDDEELANIANLHSDDMVEELNLAMKAMRSECGCEKFIAVGLCSGALAVFQSVIRGSAIRTAVLLNPRLFFWDPEIEPRRLAKRASAGCADMSYWRRLMKGEIHPARIKQAACVAFKNLFRSERYIPAEAMAQAWRQVKAFQARMTLVFADGEPLMEEMISEKQMPPSEIPSIRCVRVGNTGHTFRALWAQQLLQDLIDREVESSIQQRTTSARLHGADSSHPVTKAVEMMPAEVLVAVGHAGLVDTSCGK